MFQEDQEHYSSGLGKEVSSFQGGSKCFKKRQYTFIMCIAFF